MSTSTTSSEVIMAQAQALIEEVEKSLAAGADFWRSQGIDPENVRQHLQERLTDQEHAQAQKEFDAEVEAVKQEVQEEITRRAFANPIPSSPKRQRNMI